MQVPEIINFCHKNNIYITAKPVNNGFAKIEIQNTDKIIIGNNNQQNYKYSAYSHNNLFLHLIRC